MKIDASLLVSNPLDAARLARELEEAGFDGAYTFEGPHDPFLPLAIAAEHTERMTLMTGIAVAFARNPMLVANLGYDLQLMSKGRFILGLGPQIKAHIERRYSMPWSEPAKRMGEFVRALRAIWASWQHGERLDFRGDFYSHTLMAPTFNPGPNPYGLPKVYLAGVGPLMTETAGEVGDGFLVHPFNTPEFIEARLMPSLQRGLDRSSRQRTDLDIACQLIIATGQSSKELEDAKSIARGQIAFYGSTPAYKGVLEHHGLLELHQQLHALSREGKWMEMSALIDDPLLERIAVVGSPDEVAAIIRQRCANRVERVSPTLYQSTPALRDALLRALKREFM